LNFSEIIDTHFPFKTYNPGQKEAIEFAVKHLLAGKSAIATTVHRVLKTVNASHRTAIVTATKGLQEQYLRDDRHIISLKGRQNYPCNKKTPHYGSAACKTLCAVGGCIPTKYCDYVKAREEWRLEADLRLTNTSFQIKAPASLIGEEDSRVNLTIIDECHEIDEQLVDHAALTIDVSQMAAIEKAAGKNFTGRFAAFINEFSEMDEGYYFVPDEVVMKNATDLIDALYTKADELEKKSKEHGHGSLMAADDDLKTWISDLSRFAFSGGEWIIEEFAYAQRLVLTPVYANQVVENGLYSKCDQFIHMSATICGFDEYMKTMGIDPATAVVIDAHNPIPVEQRPVYAMNAMKVSGSYDKEKLAALVDKIIDRHGDDNGVIHTVSFQLAKDLRENSRHKRRMVISNDRDEILSLLKKKGVILLSPSVEAGYDFKGDMARWQILAKVPFAFLGSHYIKLNMDRDAKWYARKAVVRLVQAAGRAVRGVDDYATTYVIDSNFDRLYSNNPELFPSWFREAVKKV
jgi:ATP-dependent DNA helicase DinG